MTHIHSKSGRTLALVLLAGPLGCSGNSLTLPQPDVEVNLTVVSGNQQTGTVGERLPKPLIVELRDEVGQVIVGRRVAFVVTEGPAAATFAPDTVVTDGDGQALGQWVLGITPGAYAAEARVLPPTTSEPSSFDLPVAEFTASAQPGRPDSVRLESQSFQTGKRHQSVAYPPTVRVLDRYGNLVEGAGVQWVITAGGGSVSSPIVSTDADGLATVDWVLGSSRLQKVEARLDGGIKGSPAVFSAVIIF